ncbi:hypothetical protein [Pseudosulfitobacter pseudonitzschiae]|uniref:hypothetical protein n=1 Tax=Pseudosulfitobacter pseudonitzschiae TaxID=1402135 RepID=UPI003B7E8C2E
MSRLRSNDIDSPQDSIYGCGLCHVHAIAAARYHEAGNGRFLVIEDHDEICWSSEHDPDDYIPAVLHVYSLHPTPQGLVARDILGDRVAEDAEEECRDVYCAINTSCTEVDLEGLHGYIQGFEDDLQIDNGIELPLSPVTESAILDALTEPSVIEPFATPNMENSPW